MITRIIIAVVCFVVAMLVTPALFRVLTFPLTSDVWLILRVCFAALALLYIVRGSWPRSTPPIA